VIVAAAIAVGSLVWVVPVGEASYPGRNGLIAFNRQFAGTISVNVVRGDGTGLRDLRLWGAIGPSWSPDGKKIAYCMEGDGPFGAIWVADANGRHARKVLSLFSRYGCEGPTWSPDGRRIAFTARRAIYTAAISGRGRRALTRPSAEFGFYPTSDGPAWSPKGDRIAYQRFGRARTIDIWTMKPDGSGKRRLTHSHPHIWAAGPIWSPDGGRIMYTREQVDTPFVNGAVYVMNSDGTGKHRLDPYSNAGAWSPDGRMIAFTGERALGFDFGIWIGELDGGGQRQLTDPVPEHLMTVGPLADDYGPDWQPLPR